MTMRQTQTAVLERNTTFTESFSTEPFEVAWAAEARWFVHISRFNGDPARLVLTTQISPDGLNWCDHESPVREAGKVGLVTWPVREFGGWLRLRGEFQGEGGSATATIYLVLKS